ncbi:glycosyltransferase family A protein [Chondromyces crocatus]|uniref:Family 2 glycosyl transferase n=1 Tax=Chondromyces crocatus TaxID=52 RepID=A0A0K1ECJ7_CHOCO|nr:glycosyltransferase family A protein [Chondromyces crocatus]AKT38308.1 family 2 glycosyl transferase [Chondromyces crocatus]
MIDAAVIIPTRGDRPTFLRRALSSVLAQTTRPREILVVVDGDDARRTEVLSQIDGLPCRVLSTGRPRGAGAARNQGAREARAHHLCFLDDDDVWKPGYLAAVFAEGPGFDLALTAFEKHTHDAIRPEKVPPQELTRTAFLVANPGIRGSNLVLTRALYGKAEGFSEHLPAFNDMDFGLRLVEARPVHYRRICEPLVEYHAHDGERLSRRGASAIPPGMEGFLDAHGPTMDHRQEAAFRARAIALWDVDPWTLPALERRLLRASKAGTLPAHFPGLLHAAETALLEATCRSDDETDAHQAFIDRLSHAFERERGAPRLRRLRLLVITTDTPGSVAGFLASLQTALDRSGWRLGIEGPGIEILFVRNDQDPEVDQAHDAVLRRWTDRRVAITQHDVPRADRPLSLTEARRFAHRAAQHRAWTPSPDEPLWMLDEDFRFEMLVPSNTRGFRLVPGGSLLHRVACLALQHGPRGVDALLGGNSGAPPVPALGTLRRQLLDLATPATPERLTEGPLHPTAVQLGRRDAYYDLSTDPLPELHVPMRMAWWSRSGAWSWETVVDRLLQGLPVTRPALPWLGAPASAWGDLEAASVAGGNTLLLTPRVLRPEDFVQLRWGRIRSRRGDTTWCITCQAGGARIARASFPLFHDRTPRKGRPPRESAVHDMIADALGVGLYEALRDTRSLDRPSIEACASRRLAAVVESLGTVITLLKSSKNAFPEAFGTELLSVAVRAQVRLADVRFDAADLHEMQEAQRP